jgi:carboxyl-terminal processing protease
MSLDEIIALVKGPEGTEVTLTIVREEVEEPFDLTVVRALIETPVVESEMLEDGVAYVRLSSFTSDAIEQLSEHVDTLLAEDPVGMILDLRDNRGGFLNQAVAVSDLFLPKGVVVIQRDSSGVEEVFESDDGDIAEAIPLVVLVNAASASASEIVAGAIQDLDRGILIGELTFGKGSVQLSRTLSDGSELRVTIARWYTPDNSSIEHEGVLPDIELEPPEEYGTENDTQLQRAIQYLLDGE